MPGAEGGVPGSFVIRFHGPGGQPVGVGVLVGEREVVTCAHVVNAALGLDRRSQDQPAAVVVGEFPLLSEGGAATTGQVAMRVVRWLPPPREGAAGDDVAGLAVETSAGTGLRPARLLLNLPGIGQRLRVFGYPPGRPEGVWAAAAVAGRVGNGRLQLDCDPDAAWRVQPGFSGSPVLDPTTGRVAGIIASAAPAKTEGRDSYAITADRLRLAWPQVFDPHRRASATGKLPVAEGSGDRRLSVGSELTVLHLSDLLFGSGRLLHDRVRNALFGLLHDDLETLAVDHGLRPDLVVVTGDLAASGMPSQYAQVGQFLAGLAEAVEVPRRHVVIVPGNRDVNRKACAAYFAEQDAGEQPPVPPFWPKWRYYAAVFDRFYADVEQATFTPDEPWSLFEIPDLRVVVAGPGDSCQDARVAGVVDSSRNARLGGVGHGWAVVTRG